MRLRNYDYSQPGSYFVTICVQHRKCLFGTIIDGKMRLNEIGRIVVECWNHISQHIPSVELDEYVVMPNHMHGIIAWARSVHTPESTADRRGEVISPSLDSRESTTYRRGEVLSPSLDSRESTTYRRGEVLSPSLDSRESTTYRRGEVLSPSLGKIVAYFKYQSTKRINQHHNIFPMRIWQRNYYDHVVRDDIDLQRLRQYVQNNAMKWELDQLHPDNPSKW